MSEKKPENWRVHEDCFAINDYLTDCKCLKGLYCKTEDCNFYKPKSEIDWETLEKATSSYIIKYGK